LGAFFAPLIDGFHLGAILFEAIMSLIKENHSD